MAYFEVPKNEIIQSIIIQLIGKEEVVLSKWVSEKSIIGKKHLSINPYSEIVKGKVLIDEKDVNYYFNHQYCIYKHIEELKSDEENLGQGQFRLPFSFILPNVIAGSFKYEWVSDKMSLNYGAVTYRVRVILSTDQKIYGSKKNFLVQ